VTLRQTGDSLTIVAVKANPGWSYQIDQAGPDHEVEVHFTGPSGEIEFKAEADNGQVNVEVHGPQNGDSHDGETPSDSQQGDSPQE